MTEVKEIPFRSLDIFFAVALSDYSKLFLSQQNTTRARKLVGHFEIGYITE